MKKFLSIVLAVVMCLSMASIAFAGTTSGTTSGGTQSGGTGSGSYGTEDGEITNTVVSAVDANGNSAVVVEKTLETTNAVYQEVKTAGTTEKFLETAKVTEDVEKAIADYDVEAKDLTVHSTIDVSVKSGSPKFPLTINIAVAGVKTTDLVVLVHKASTGYEVIPAKVVKDGQIEAVFNSLSPVVVLVKKDAELKKEEETKEGYEICEKGTECLLTAFSDLVADAWYHDGVHYCLDNSIMNGVGDGKFDPAGTTSRAMIVTMLWRKAGSPVVNYAMTFEDVAEDTWYTEAFRWAQSIGLVNGYSDKACGPNDSITREQLATMIYRYEKIINNGGFAENSAWLYYLDYPDRADISSWATEAIYWVVMKGIVNGKDGKLDPTGLASRAEAAAMIQRYCTLD